jgi:hypothetical protein
MICYKCQRKFNGTKEAHIVAVIPNHGKTSFCWNCAAGDIDG